MMVGGSDTLIVIVIDPERGKMIGIDTGKEMDGETGMWGEGWIGIIPITEMVGIGTGRGTGTGTEFVM